MCFRKFCSPFLAVGLGMLALVSGTMSARAAYTVTASAPTSISYGSFASSNATQTAYISGGSYSVTDSRGSIAGYYATLSISDLVN
jgi:hypothetical protein